MLKKRFPLQKFVVIVGMSHVEGIKGFLKNPSSLDDFLADDGIAVNEAKEVDCKEIMEYQ